MLLAGTAGGVGIRLWDKSSHESQRINLLVQEIQQTRGDLYRQMKEIFDAYFLSDEQAEEECNAYTESIESHFVRLRELSEGEEELSAINDIAESYQAFLKETRPVLTASLYFLITPWRKN